MATDSTAPGPALNDEPVVNAKTFHEQIGLLCLILRPDGRGVSLGKIGELFVQSKSHATIKRHFLAFQKTPQSPGRPELLTEKITNVIKETGHPSLHEIYSEFFRY